MHFQAFDQALYSMRGMTFMGQIQAKQMPIPLDSSQHDG